MRSLTTFGLTSKEGQSKIGRFGTGLKYGVATILRNGGSLQILSGEDEFVISTLETDFRGQDHHQVTINGQNAPFTTSLGRDWEPWMAFRELYSNALDEGGKMFRLEDGSAVSCEENETIIAVQMPAFESIYFSIEEHFIVDEEPLWVGGDIEIYPGRSGFVFYNGIAIMKLEEPSHYRYNLKGHISLTEDRTAQYPWMVSKKIASALTAITDEAIARNVTKGTHGYEKTLDFLENCQGVPSATFLGAAAQNGLECNETAAALAKAHLPDRASASVTIISPEQPGGACLLNALKRLRSLKEEPSEVKWVLDPTLRIAGSNFTVKGDLVFLCNSVFDSQDRMNIAVFDAWEEKNGSDWKARKLVQLADEVSSNV